MAIEATPKSPSFGVCAMMMRDCVRVLDSVGSFSAGETARVLCMIFAGSLVHARKSRSILAFTDIFESPFTAFSPFALAPIQSPLQNEISLALLVLRLGMSTK